jgi:hypothetical protein
MMKTKLVTLRGELRENLYQLGLSEKEHFQRLEARVTGLLSQSFILRQGKEILSRARATLRRREGKSAFEAVVEAYAEGLGIDTARYLSFLSLFEMAAHYGQAYPELKGFLPGCASIFSKRNEEISHIRLFDFPLIGIFEEEPRLYQWQLEDKPTFLSYSCAGLAPLFFQGVHECGISIALHHKPGNIYFAEGESIFKIAMDSVFELKNLTELRRELKKYSSVTKWSFLAADNKGAVQVMDIEGPQITTESFNLNETAQLIFTNIPLQNDVQGYESFLNLCSDRQSWLKEKLSRKISGHPLDAVTDIKNQSEKKWIHPGSTLSTIGAYEVNLTKGYVDLKEGTGALTSADSIIRLALDASQEMKILRPAEEQSATEKAWKLASIAQSDFDQGLFAEAYHHLQMAQALMPQQVWKNIFSFYMCLWDFRFVNHKNDLSQVYKKVKNLKLPPSLHPQWVLFMMRLEKKLGLSYSVKSQDLPESFREVFEQEIQAKGPIFSAWMKLLYPRLEILDVFSPHDQK